MHYFNFHIGDYISHTLHLSAEEDLAYRRLLDMYYDSEQPIPNNIPLVSRRLRMGSDVVESILKEFFEPSEEGYRNRRADLEIREYHGFIEKQRNNGKLGGRPKKTQPKPTANPSLTQKKPNQEPITNNHKPIDKQNRGSRLHPEFGMPDEWGQFCEKERPDLVPRKVFEGFRDYWIAKAGQQGVKLDWFATWRNWVRNQKQGLVNKADQVFTTVPSRFERDPALIAVEQKLKEAVPMPPEIRAAMERLRK